MPGRTRPPLQAPGGAPRGVVGAPSSSTAAPGAAAAKSSFGEPGVPGSVASSTRICLRCRVALPVCAASLAAGLAELVSSVRVPALVSGQNTGAGKKQAHDPAGPDQHRGVPRRHHDRGRSVGSGPTLALVGGAFTDRRALAPFAQALAPYFTVFAYDRRGRGDSGDTPPYAVAREIEDLAAVIAAAGGPACVFGHSSGAGLAVLAAADGPPSAGWPCTSRRTWWPRRTRSRRTAWPPRITELASSAAAARRSSSG